MKEFEHFLALLALALCILTPAWWFWFEREPVIGLPEAKRLMEEKVIHDHRVTLYCQAPFDRERVIADPEQFGIDQPQQMTWEHAVPVSEFGRLFPEWHDGHPECVKNGKQFKGRKCAEKVNGSFRQMEADMYNLFPAIALVNARRSNRQYAELPNAPAIFGSCGAKAIKSKFEPPDEAKGEVGRAALYMEGRYKEFALDPEQRALFEEWNWKFPVTRWECIRARRIEKLQKVENPFIKTPCKELGLWPGWWF